MLVLAVITAPGAQDEELRPLDDSEIMDSLSYEDSTGYIEQSKDTVAAEEYVQTSKAPNKLKLVKRGYNYREQLSLALGMMAFVALILTTTQNWNPD